MIEALLEFRQIVGTIDNPRVPACVLPGKLPGRKAHAYSNTYNHGKD
jgi:hypothetical protein